MNSIHKAITILGVTAVLGGLAPAVSAQPPRTLSNKFSNSKSDSKCSN